MQNLCLELTHSVYPHDQIYGDYCPIQGYINCPPEDTFQYLADTKKLAEWTYSLRNPMLHGEPDLYRFTDQIGGTTPCFCRTVANREALTVDYHCAWDQPDHLWMIYLMRVVPAQLVLDKPGSVVLWVNCHHPFYTRNPYPETAVPGRNFWVGDAWPMFYAGHTVELQNLKLILEHRHAHGLPVLGTPAVAASEVTA
ncbi:hypothetical protein AAW51_2852 [Caldimonas brevitalea]|uniref:SRPBCC family protein n=2 Tax=Caldimonas brevitalea TaxID=413882 RepID=A0A0G3BNH4_9BURK|nr:hypothetical protein AAW51_2852 [Caldimonas brevitalea]